VRLVGEERFEAFLKYLTGYAGYFRAGECNLFQFKLRKLAM
jgi:cyclopropane fatty-acyl-phospholipid synthase-like methyltransferase